MRARIALVAAAAAIVFSAVIVGASQAATTPTHPDAQSTQPQSPAAPALRSALRARAPGSIADPAGRQLRLVEWMTVRRDHPPAPPPPPPPPVVEAAAAPVVYPPPPAYVGPGSDATSTTTPDWACIRDHESSDNYAEDNGNGYSGAYQFAPSTWNEAVSGAGYWQYANGWAYEAPPAVQNAAALWLYNQDGWSPWSTRYVCGL